MLNIVWCAILEDSSVIRQYDLNGRECLFKEVLDSRDKLKRFMLCNRFNGEVFIVDLVDGYISKTKEVYGVFKPRVDMLRKQQYDYRLIYFREVERTFNQKLSETGNPKINYFLGFQYTDENSKNHKRMIKISETGDWVVN